MPEYELLRRSELQELLLEKGVITKKVNKSFIVTLLNNFNNGNLKVRTSNLEVKYESEVEALKERIRELEDDLTDKSIHLNRTRDYTESYKTLALEAEEALNSKIQEQSEIIDQLKSQLTAVTSVNNLDFNCENCPVYLNNISELNKSIQIQILELSLSFRDY